MIFRTLNEILYLLNSQMDGFMTGCYFVIFLTLFLGLIFREDSQ